ncbi:hypothetical protein N7512_002537 [Penicillium capsulatum]|nr:hypothetical protein N7512_002537 [Penicillium capsulatum]
METDKKTQRRSPAAPRPRDITFELYVPRRCPLPSGLKPDIPTSTDPLPATAPDPSDRPRHPSLSRVKGRSNMYSPPRSNTDNSWLNDQSPVRGAIRTPPRQPRTPEAGTPTMVNPASSLLQDLLKEQRANRSSRGTVPDGWEDNTPRTPEGPRVQEDTASEKARKVSDALSNGQRQPMGMGMREMDQYVSKMNKLNFDLKLEIFHRTQQMGALEKKVQRMHEMEEELERMHKVEEEMEQLRSAEKENKTLRETNERLRGELKTKDQAVAEAVQFICSLETKIEELQSGGRTSQFSMPRLVLDGPNASTPKPPAAIDIPERTSSRRQARTNPAKLSEPREPVNTPSFLQNDNKSTATLRSLYAPDNNKSQATLGELTKSDSLHTMNEATELGSPRLSVLSECSELHPFDTQTGWQDFDKLDIPLRKTASTTGSLDSYVTSVERDHKENQEDQWFDVRPDLSQTIIKRRINRAMSDASNAGAPSLGGNLYSNKPRGRGRLDVSLFGGARLPPTPDTMSTAYATAHNGSNGSIAPQKSPKQVQDSWFAGRPLERRRSADELATRRSFNGSDITDSMQTNCSDTPRLGTTNVESPTFFPFNTVASKARELLGPGSPSYPAVDPFTNSFEVDTKAAGAASTNGRCQTPTMIVTPQTQAMEDNSSPPLTPQDWIAAGKQRPRPRKVLENGLCIEQQENESSQSVFIQPTFHDDQSIDSYSAEPEVAGIPTLDLDTLDILEQPAQPQAPQSQPEPEPEPRRRFSFRPNFLSRSHGPRRLQSSPMAPDYPDDEEDGAPSPIIPKTRNMGGAQRRPMSQIINSADLYSSSLPANSDAFGDGFNPKALHKSFMEARESSVSAYAGSNTVAARPTTSHSVQSSEHKRRSSLGLFGWMKGMGSKKSEPATPVVTDKFPDSVHVLREQRTSSRLGHEAAGLDSTRASTPDSMDAPVVRPRSEMTMYSDDQSRRPRYMGRRSRRT